MCLRAIFTMLCFLFLTMQSYATEDEKKTEKEVVLVSAQEVHEGDLFAWGKSIEISGTVTGDVYLIGGQIHIDGKVHGDVLAIGGSVHIAGEVSKSCRVIGGQVLLSGRVHDNVSCVSGDLQTLPSASIGGNLVCASGNVEAAAPVEGDLTMVIANMRLSSHVGKDVQGYVGKLRVTSKAVIGHDLDYRSSSIAIIDPGAEIRGQVIYHPSLVHQLMDQAWLHKLFVGSKVLIILMNFLYTVIMGFILCKYFPANLKHALQALSQTPMTALFYGVLVVIFLPIAALILMATVIGVPFALTVMALNVIGVYTAKIYTLMWASNWTVTKCGWKRRNGVFFLFTIVYFVLGAIPFLGSILAFVALLFGLGAAVMAQMTRRLSFKP